MKLQKDEKGHFLAEDRDKIVKEYMEGKESIEKVSEKYEISKYTLSRWVDGYKKAVRSNTISEQEKEIETLRTRVADLEKENAVLKETMVTIVKGSK